MGKVLEVRVSTNVLPLLTVLDHFKWKGIEKKDVIIVGESEEVL